MPEVKIPEWMGAAVEDIMTLQGEFAALTIGYRDRKDVAAQILVKLWLAWQDHLKQIAVSLPSHKDVKETGDIPKEGAFTIMVDDDMYTRISRVDAEGIRHPLTQKEADWVLHAIDVMLPISNLK